MDWYQIYLEVVHFEIWLNLIILMNGWLLEKCNGYNIDVIVVWIPLKLVVSTVWASCRHALKKQMENTYVFFLTFLMFEQHLTMMVKKKAFNYIPHEQIFEKPHTRTNIETNSIFSGKTIFEKPHTNSQIVYIKWFN